MILTECLRNLAIEWFTLFTKILQSHIQNMVNIAVVSVGCLLLVLAILIYFTPIMQDGHTAFQDEEICTSGDRKSVV